MKTDQLRYDFKKKEKRKRKIEEMNKEEAERALNEAHKRISSGNINEALKYLKISQRLSPSPHTEQLIARYSSSSSSNSNSSTNTIHTSNDNYEEIISTFKTQFNILLEKILQLESKYVNPSMKNYIRILFLIVFILFIFKYIFKQKIGFGSLPGDISYSSSNTMIAFPVVSSLLASFLLQGLGYIFRR